MASSNGGAIIPIADRAISKVVLARLLHRIESRMGLHLDPELQPDLMRRLRLAAHDFGYGDDLEACARWLLDTDLGQLQIETLASHLTIGETYFFREKSSLDALERSILPQILNKQQQGGARTLRIWSAGCCSGEEPYSLAIMLDRLLPDRRQWNVSILATDINPAFLRKATHGVYTEWSFRRTPAWARKMYFARRSDGRYEIASRIKQMVNFSALNLIEDPYPSLLNQTNNLDIILCRNVLIYFAQDTIKRVVEQFHSSLVDTGWLMVGPVEGNHLLSTLFTPVKFPGAILYQKQRQPSAPVAPLPSVDILSLNGGSVAVDQPLFSESDTAVKSVAVELADHFDPKASLTSNALPVEEKAMLALIRNHANAREFDEAQLWCETAIAADKLNPLYHHLMANTLQEQGHLDRAMRTFKNVLFLDPSFVMAHFALGNLCQQQGLFAEADKHFRNASTLLDGVDPDTQLSEAEGVTAEKLRETINILIKPRGG